MLTNDHKSRTLEIESRKIQEVLSKVLGYLRGTPGERIVDSMIACAQQMSRLESHVEDCNGVI